MTETRLPMTVDTLQNAKNSRATKELIEKQRSNCRKSNLFLFVMHRQEHVAHRFPYCSALHCAFTTVS
jgi:hypothetical protein